MPTSGEKKKLKELPQDAESLIHLLEKSWPQRKSKEIIQAFSALRKVVKQRQKPSQPSEGETQEHLLDILDLLRRTLSAHDLLFLRRQITYHLAASAGLPRVYADSDRIQMATAQLVEYMAKRAPRSSRISVQLQEIPLRTGRGIEVSFTGTDTSLASVDKSSFAQRMFKSVDEEGQILVNCRELVASQGGQMWADLPKPKQAVFHMVLPISGGSQEPDTAPKQLYKYDISIANYANLRKRFGIKKSQVLVGQIEMYVRALVRHPIDIVTAVRDKGIITTIYETPKGAAQSVAGRISQRLGAEEFRIGKKTVSLSFRYNLSPLSKTEGNPSV